MGKKDLVHRLAAAGKTTPGAAADSVAAVVHETLRRLREGKPAVWPGLGSFLKDGSNAIRFEPARGGQEPKDGGDR
ncbi:MAG: hypothetical protein R2729_03170 [Bryobacteraceae bacterium]